MFRHTTLFCYVHLLNVTYVHKNFISCLVGLSFQKLKLLKNNHKILRPTTLICCRMIQEDWEGSDWKRKKKLTLISAFFPNLIWSVLIFVYIFGLILQFETGRSVKLVLLSFVPEKWVGLNILVESVLIFSILVTGPITKDEMWMLHHLFDNYA